MRFSSELVSGRVGSWTSWYLVKKQNMWYNKGVHFWAGSSASRIMTARASGAEGGFTIMVRLPICGPVAQLVRARAS